MGRKWQRPGGLRSNGPFASLSLLAGSFYLTHLVAPPSARPV